MRARIQVGLVIVAVLVPLLPAGQTRPSKLDFWRAHNARPHGSLECCNHIDDVRVAANVDVSELGGVGADPAGVSALSPSGQCRMHVHVRRVRLSAMYSRDGGKGAGLLVDLDVQVKGPSPRCDGSFAHLKVWDSSDGVLYRSAFSYWGGWLNITTLEHAEAAPPDQGGGGGGEGGGERLKRHTIVLPAEGLYRLEVLYDSEMYTSFLDADEGLNLRPEEAQVLDGTRTVIDPWLDAPAACFTKDIPASSPGCDCDDASRPNFYQSWPGYWAENRTKYVPLFHPRMNRWAPGPDGVHSPAARYLMRRIPGGVLISGTSRQRALFHGILIILGFSVGEAGGMPDKASAAHNLHHNPFNLSEPRPEMRVKRFAPEMGVVFHRNAEGSEFPSHGRIDLRRMDYYREAWLAELDRENLCTATSRRSVVIFSEGAHFAGRVGGPHGLAKASIVINDVLEVLARRCKATETVLMVASEMAAHDHWGAGWGTGQVGNSFRDNRIRGLNAAVEEMARKLGLTFLDVYSLSLSAGENFNHPQADPHHYHAGPLVGDIVSMTATSAYLDAISSALDSSAPAACAIEIMEPMDGHGVVLGSTDSGLRRSISIIVAASPECKGTTMSVSFSIDGVLLGEQELTKDSAGGFIAMMSAKLGEGKHVIFAAYAGPDGLVEQVSEFEILPYTWTGSIEEEDDDDDDDGEHRGTGRQASGRSIAVVACSPPLQHTDCIIHAGRVMNDTEYDLIILRNDCTKGFELTSEMTRMRLREWQASLGDREYIIDCAEQTWDTDVWWMPPNAQNDFAIYPLGLKLDWNPDSPIIMYESYVFISAQGVADALQGSGPSFSLAATHESMRRAGAHVAMAATTSYNASKGGDSNLPDHWRCAGRGAGASGVISLPRDPPILVMTSSAWECVVDQHGMKLGIELNLRWVSPISLSISCSPGGSLSACSMGQSCIFVDSA